MGCWPLKYLWLPLGHLVVENVERRLKGWRNAFLSWQVDFCSISIRKHANLLTHFFGFLKLWLKGLKV